MCVAQLCEKRWSFDEGEKEGILSRMHLQFLITQHLFEAEPYLNSFTILKWMNHPWTTAFCQTHSHWVTQFGAITDARLKGQDFIPFDSLVKTF